MATRQKEGWTQLPPFLIPNDLLKRIEDIQFEQRFPNRTEALRAILEAGVVRLREGGKAPES